MHISLDAALQRQPLLSTVGDKLLPSFPGAAAAYSLRSLNGDGNNVVEVRRDGDTDGFTNERAFTAEGVSFELEDWVNGKQETTLPCDVATSAAAYSLRKVRSAYTGDAVRIRRASDDVEVNVAFDTNGEVSDSSAITNVTESPDQGDTTATTLGGFLAEDIVSYEANSTWTGWSAFGNAASSVSGGSITVTGAVNSLSDGIRFNTFLPLTDARYRFEFNVSSLDLDGATSFDLKGNSNNIVSAVTATGSYSVDLTVDSGGWGNFISFSLQGNASTGANITIDSLKITAIGHNATVQTWYDQSGNGNDATQDFAGNQPKIAEAGSLLGKLDFDNSDDFLTTTNQFSFGNGARSIFTVCAPDSIGANTDGILQLNIQDTGTGKGWMLTPELAIRTNFTTWISSSPATLSQDNLIASIYTGGNLHSGASMYLNGAQVTRTSGNDGIINTSTSEIRIGAGFGGATPFDGGIGEIIIYASDQSDNRFKIESNINNHYGLYTSAYNGFVRTWYDQSGNGKDAVQDFNDDQPKIVANGSYLGELEFDGINSFLRTDTTVSLTQPATGFSISQTDLSATSQGVWTIATNDTTSGEIVSFYRNDSGLAINAGATLSTAGSLNYSTGVDYLKTGVYNTTTSSIFVDGTSRAAGSVGTNNASGLLYVGRMNVGATPLYLDGSIKELVIYDSDQSANRSDIESNIADEYGITLP